MATHKCDNCLTRYTAEDEDGWITVMTNDQDYEVCSLACLTELAWKLREAQPKLSKSKQEPSDVQ